MQAHSSRLSSPLPHVPAVWALWTCSGSIFAAHGTGWALAALSIIHEEQRRVSQSGPLWAVLRTQPLDQRVNTFPYLRATLSRDQFAKPVAPNCVKPSSKAHICSLLSSDLILKPGGATPIFLPCYQQIVFYKNNNPPLSQKNNVFLNHCD